MKAFCTLVPCILVLKIWHFKNNYLIKIQVQGFQNEEWDYYRTVLGLQRSLKSLTGTRRMGVNYFRVRNTLLFLDKSAIICQHLFMSPHIFGILRDQWLVYNKFGNSAKNLGSSSLMKPIFRNTLGPSYWGSGHIYFIIPVSQRGPVLSSACV